MKKKIPIFPLELVIFPQSIYILRIFEPKYKKMIEACSANDSIFGIVSIIDSHISKIGCSVRITKTFNKNDKGEFEISVIGEKRFHIIATSIHPNGYIVAEIEEYEDNLEQEDPKRLSQEVITEFKKLIDKIQLKINDSYWNNLNKADYKSFKLAEKSGLTLIQKQNMLALKSETKRLRVIRDHISNAYKLIDKAKAAIDLINSDGYLTADNL